jgi:ketosteroid isomerase-like protein
MRNASPSIPARENAEMQVRALIEDRASAVRAKDVERAMAVVAPDFLMFDVVKPMQSVGSEGSRKRTREWFSSFAGPIGCETRGLNITADGDVAFSHCLNRYSGTRTDGAKVEMWVRVTSCYRRIGGRWFLTHEHGSVPFDSPKAPLDVS